MPVFNFAEMKEYEQPPFGKKYRWAITDGEVGETGEDTKHPGVDYWRLECTIQDGPHAGKKTGLTCMLPPYEPFTLFNVLRASGNHSEEELKSGDFDIELEDLTDGSYEFVAKWVKQKGDSDYGEIKRIQPVPEDWEPEDDEESVLPG